MHRNHSKLFIVVCSLSWLYPPKRTNALLIGLNVQFDLMHFFSLVTLFVASETTDNPSDVATTVIEEAYVTTVGEVSTTEAHSVTTRSGALNNSSKGSRKITRNGALNLW